jgi:hypothetical protein
MKKNKLKFLVCLFLMVLVESCTLDERYMIHLRKYPSKEAKDKAIAEYQIILEKEIAEYHEAIRIRDIRRKGCGPCSRVGYAINKMKKPVVVVSVGYDNGEYGFFVAKKTGYKYVVFREATGRYFEFQTKQKFSVGDIFY